MSVDEPQRRTVEHREERVIYVDNTDYDDDRWYDERRCEGKTSWEMA
jgi:hypothetical protein